MHKSEDVRKFHYCKFELQTISETIARTLIITKNVYAPHVDSSEEASKVAVPATLIQSGYLLTPHHLYQIFQIHFQNHKTRN